MDVLRLSLPLHEVTVYRQGAMVCREGVVAWESAPFPERVVVENLPLTLDETSLRVEVYEIQPVADTGAGTGAPRFAIVASDVRMLWLTPSSMPSEHSTHESEVKALELEQQSVERERVLVEAAIQALAKLEPGKRGAVEKGQSPADSPFAARMHVLEFRRRRAQSLIDTVQELRQRERLLQERIDTLRQSKAHTLADRRSDEIRPACEIRLRGPKDGLPRHFRLRLWYFVAGARWVPTYTLRLDETLNRGVLEVRALVSQCTGEDWCGESSAKSSPGERAGIHLSLATSLPQRWTEAPELAAKKIGRAQTKPPRLGFRPPPVGVEALYRDYDLAWQKKQDKGKRDDERALIVAQELARMAGSPPELAAPPGKSAKVRAAAPMGAMPPPVAMASQAAFSSPPPPPMVAHRARSSGPSDEMRQTFAAAPSPMPDPTSAGRDTAPVGPTEQTLGDKWIDFGELRLAPSRSVGERGRLVSRGQLASSTVLNERARLRNQAVKFEQSEVATGHCLPNSNDGYYYTYRVAAPMEIASDARDHLVPVIHADVAPTMRYIAVPQEDPAVYRHLTLKNPWPSPLLAGPVDVYVGERYLLTSDLRALAAAGEVPLALGIEDAIKIARNVRYDEENAGLLKRQQSTVHAVEITVVNHLKHAFNHPIKLEVRERIATAAAGQENEVQIALRQVTPAWTAYDQSEAPIAGSYAWHLELAAGEKRTLKATWALSIPPNFEVVGGNRRGD